MRTLALLTLCVALSARAAEWSDNEFPQTPLILSRLIEGAEANPQLHSEVFFNDGQRSALYLAGARYIGCCDAPFGRVHVALLFYIRSGGQDTKQMARGRTHLVFYDKEFKARRIWEVDMPDEKFFFEKKALHYKPDEGEDRILFDYDHLPKDPTKVQIMIDSRSYFGIPIW